MYILLFMIISHPAFATSKEKGLNVDPKTLQMAVKLASQVDAYNAYCNKESQLANGVLKKFFTSDDASSQKNRRALEDNITRDYKTMFDLLLSEKKDCGDGQFLLDKFAVMKQLKILLMKLSGLDVSSDEPVKNIPQQADTKSSSP